MHVPERLISIWDKSHANVSCQEIIAAELLVFIVVKHNLTRESKGGVTPEGGWDLL